MKTKALYLILLSLLGKFCTETSAQNFQGQGSPVRSSVNQTLNDSAAAKNGVFHNQPLSEAEINATMQKPLRLNDCIQIALSKNFALRQAEHELDKAEAFEAGTYSKFFPTFSLQGVQEYTQEKRSIDPLNPVAQQKLFFENQAVVAQVIQKLPTGATVQLSTDLRRDLNSPDIFGAPPTRTRNRLYSISVTQPLLRDGWPAMTRNSINIAQNERQNRDRQLLNAKWETIFAVKRAYYAVALQRELIKVNQAAILRDSTLVEASVSMSTAKMATRRDVLSAEIRLADDRAALIRAQTDYQLALDLLKEVMGVSLTTPIDLSSPELRFAPVDLNEETLIETALQNNPLLHGTALAITVGKLQLREAKNTLLPQLDLIGSLSGRFDTNTDQNKDLENYGGQVMLSLNYALFSRDAAARAEQAQINVVQQEERLLEQQRQMSLNIRSIVRSVYSGREELSALQRSIVAAEQKVDFATTMFNLGRASNLDIIDAQESLLRTQNLYARKLVDYYTQLALLESITGQSIQ